MSFHLPASMYGSARQVGLNEMKPNEDGQEKERWASQAQPNPPRCG